MVYKISRKWNFLVFKRQLQGVLQIKRLCDSWRRAFGEGLVVCTQLTVHRIENLKFE